MGIIETVLVVCLVLKACGVAFVDLGYMELLGWYALSIISLTLIAHATVGTIMMIRGEKDDDPSEQSRKY